MYPYFYKTTLVIRLLDLYQYSQYFQKNQLMMAQEVEMENIENLNINVTHNVTHMTTLMTYLYV